MAEHSTGIVYYQYLVTQAGPDIAYTTLAETFFIVEKLKRFGEKISFFLLSIHSLFLGAHANYIRPSPSAENSKQLEAKLLKRFNIKQKPKMQVRTPNRYKA